MTCPFIILGNIGLTNEGNDSTTILSFEYKANNTNTTPSLHLQPHTEESN